MLPIKSPVPLAQSPTSLTQMGNSPSTQMLVNSEHDRLSGRIHSLAHLNLELLAALGIQAILLQGRAQTFQVFDPATTEWINQAQRQGFSFLWLATPQQAEEVHPWCDRVDIPILNTKNKLMVLALREAFACFEVDPRQVLLVSDRPLWELWDAQLLRMPVMRIGIV
ncbi:MAG: hypothetical protein VKJ24_03445 [Synechococcales bacterium]|nr:hypothetical protein [Synechococcales bacterium]